MGVHNHRKSSPVSVRCFVITVSDSRDETTDESGSLAKTLLMEAGHLLTGYRVIPDEPETVTSLVREIAESDRADAVLINGGTGLSRRDTTYEALSLLLDKTLPGFGELFRSLSHKEIGPAAMLTRAIGGAVGPLAVFSTPGSPNAVRLAMEALIVPELGHVVRELRR
jgi:molybdenum cofactor biosynthesis protein B